MFGSLVLIKRKKMKNKKQMEKSLEMKFFGGFISKKVYNLISLYCLVRGVSKSYILRELLARKEFETPLSEQNMLRYLSKGINHDWKLKKLYKYQSMPEQEITKNFIVFKEGEKTKLIQRGLPLEYINKILKKVVNGKNKKENQT
jgi:hypothetical protein